jgi:hypothetical protein
VTTVTVRLQSCHGALLRISLVGGVLGIIIMFSLRCQRESVATDQSLIVLHLSRLEATSWKMAHRFR